MKTPEQLTINEIAQGSFTLADLALYGGIFAVGFAFAMYLLTRK